MSAEQTQFAVILVSAGSSKLKVIKTILEITGLGLEEVKELVEGAPSTLTERASREDAEEMERILGEAGATVELR